MLFRLKPLHPPTLHQRKLHATSPYNFLRALFPLLSCLIKPTGPEESECLLSGLHQAQIKCHHLDLLV